MNNREEKIKELKKEIEFIEENNELLYMQILRAKDHIKISQNNEIIKNLNKEIKLKIKQINN